MVVREPSRRRGEGARVACPSCGTQNAFSTDGQSKVKVKCGRCSTKFKAHVREEPQASLRLCRSCGTLNKFLRTGGSLPDVMCGHCGTVSPPASPMLEQFLSNVEICHQSMLQDPDSPSVRIEVDGRRRSVPLVLLLSLMAQHRLLGNAATSMDIAALPTHRVEGTCGEQARCPVCLEDFKHGDDLKTLPCLHLYHQACAERWLRTDNSCPVCKTPIS